MKILQNNLFAKSYTKAKSFDNRIKKINSNAIQTVSKFPCRNRNLAIRRRKKQQTNNESQSYDYLTVSVESEASTEIE